jgi:hypothetical protein
VRVDDHTLDLDLSEIVSFFRAKTEPLTIGSVVETEAFSVRVENPNDGFKYRIRVTFTKRLDDLTFLTFMTTPTLPDGGIFRLPAAPEHLTLAAERGPPPNSILARLINLAH